MVIPFLGREEELRTLRAHFDAACARNLESHDGPRFVLLAAESGVGKSRLVQQLYHQLTTDPHWDPPEVDYWPDAFGGVGDEVRVNPEMQGHTRHGPARFFWLGVSWTEPGERKAPCDRALTALKHVLDLHVGVRERDRFSLTPLRSLATEVATELAESVIPGVGVGKRAIGAIREIGSNIRHRNRTIADEEHAQASSVTEELLGNFQSVLGGSNSIPVVLWLDDAQWIDDESTHFIRHLWDLAKKRRWPLLIVATHWEREWRTRMKAPHDEATAGIAMCMGPQFETWLLPSVRDTTLRQIAAHAFPGLSPANLDLMVEKACSNCLTLVENIGELRDIDGNFTDRNLLGDLSPAGQETVRNWEKDRGRRAEQRFMTIGPELRDLLGWSSRLGQRFLSGVVTDFAAHVRALPNAEDLLEYCVDPFAILARPSKLTRQFRDKAFHHVARTYFERYSREDEQSLTDILQQHLVTWINDSFEPNGELETNAVEADKPTAGALLAHGQREELRDLLDMARAELPLCTSSPPLGERSLAALRARALALVNDATEHLYLRAQDLASELEPLDWTSMPTEALGIEVRSQLSAACGALAKHALASQIQRSVVHELERTLHSDSCPNASELATVPRQFELTIQFVAALNAMTSHLLAIEGRIGEALEFSQRAIACSAQFSTESERDQGLQARAVTLTLASRVHHELTDYEVARDHLEEALAIRSQLAAGSEDPERLRDHAMSMLQVCSIWTWDWEQIEGAEQSCPTGRPSELLEEALAIMRQLVDCSPTQANLVDLARALEAHGDEHRNLHSYMEALDRYEEAQAIRRRLFAGSATPNHLRSLAKSLVKIGETVLDRARELGESNYQVRAHDHRGNQDNERLLGADDYLTEALELWQDLTDLIGDSESRRQQARVQELLGIAHHERGEVDHAIAHYQHSLELFETVNTLAASQRSRSDVERLQEAINLLRHEDASVLPHDDASVPLHDDASLLLPDDAVAAKIIELQELRQQILVARRIFLQADELAPLLRPQFGFFDQGPPRSRSRDSGDSHEYEDDEQTLLDGSSSSGYSSEGSLSHANILEQIGLGKYSRGNLASALEFLIQASELRVALTHCSSLSESKEALLNCLYGIGKLCQELGSPTIATVAFTRALELGRDLLRESGSGARLRTVAVLLGRLGDAELARGSRHLALEHYRKSLRMLDALLHGLGTSESQREVSFMLAQIGGVEMESGDLDGALESFREATAKAGNPVSET